jgi:phosphatidylserine decarboxylase
VMHTDNFGDVTQVEVGAMLVGRIVNDHGAGPCNRGEEKGRFEFGGSTIVLLTERGKVKPDEELLSNTRAGDETKVKCGERLGVREVTDR